jgi:hypothetical protein
MKQSEEVNARTIFYKMWKTCDSYVNLRTAANELQKAEQEQHD